MNNKFENILNTFNNMTDEQMLIATENAVYETLSNKQNKKAYIQANELKVGSQIAEADGYLFDVIEIVKKTDKTITVRLASDFSSIHTHWAKNGGVLKTFRKNTKLYGIA